jgi:hypothetical protein
MFSRGHAMTTRVGVGRSLSYDSLAAGREAAEAAKASLDGEASSLTLVFSTAGHDQEAVIAGVAEVLGAKNLSGCSAEGVITQRGSDECSHAVAVMAVASDDVVFRTYSALGFGADARGAGRSLAEQVRRDATERGLLLLFPDGIRGNCRELIASIEEGLPRLPLLAGGTAGDMLRFERTYQFHDGAVHSDSVSAVLVEGAFEAELLVSHGCDLIGQEHTVTRADDCFVYEIDGRPAWSLFKTYLADDAQSLDAMHLAHMILAEHVDADEANPAAAIERFAPRVPVALDVEQGALYFAAGLVAGTTVQLALRNPEKVVEHAEAVTRALVDRRVGQAPFLVVQLDCAGRGRLLFEDRATEGMVDPVRRILGESVPWIGLHTYGEIAPVGAHTVFQNYAGVLCALYAAPAHD